jgi:hypothetical protein
MLEGSLLKLGKRSSSPFGIRAGAPASRSLTAHSSRIFKDLPSLFLRSHATGRLTSRFVAQTWQGDRGWLIHQHAWPRDFQSPIRAVRNRRNSQKTNGRSPLQSPTFTRFVSGFFPTIWNYYPKPRVAAHQLLLTNYDTFSCSHLQPSRI